MAGDHLGRGHIPRQDRYDDSQYPPVPGEEDERSRPIPLHSRPLSQMASVTLPSIQDRPEMYGSPGARSWDPRASGYGPSPTSTSGYPPPPGSVPVPPGTSYSPAVGGSAYPPPGGPAPYSLPPVQSHGQDPRSSYPPDPRSQAYYAAQAPGSFSGGGNVYEYGYRQDRGPPPYAQEYARGGPAGSAVIAHGQSAPRQRTSIACKYCRRRKVRSYQALLRQEHGDSVTDRHLDSLQWLCQFPGRKMYKLYKNEPRMYFSASFVYIFYRICSRVGITKRCPARCAIVRSLRPAASSTI